MNVQERLHKKSLDQMEQWQAATIATQQAWLEAICKATSVTTATGNITQKLCLFFRESQILIINYIFYLFFPNLQAE
jgi:hypothetical protein